MQATARLIGLAFAVAALGIVIATASARPASAAPDCASVVLDEWTSGALTSKHPADCYEAAIDALPEDLRAYTSAADDISRVAITATRQAPARELAAAPVADENMRSVPLTVVLMAVFLILLAASGLAASIVRRRRAR